MKKLDLSFYLILDPDLCDGIEGMVKTTAIAVENGITMIQLRSERPFSKKKWYQAAVALKKCLESTLVPLIINNHPDIALATAADGVHIGQTDMSALMARKLLGANKIIGLSISTLSHLRSVPSGINYLGIGPVFSTTTKADAAMPLGISGLQKIIEQKKLPAVAIGGITRKNADAVLATGVEGIAIISAICGQKNIATATRQLQQAITTRDYD